MIQKLREIDRQPSSIQHHVNLNAINMQPFSKVSTLPFFRRTIELFCLARLMLVTDVGDEMCWRQLLDVDNSMFYH